MSICVYFAGSHTKSFGQVSLWWSSDWWKLGSHCCSLPRNKHTFHCQTGYITNFCETESFWQHYPFYPFLDSQLAYDTYDVKQLNIALLFQFIYIYTTKRLIYFSMYYFDATFIYLHGDGGNFNMAQENQINACKGLLLAKSQQYKFQFSFFSLRWLRPVQAWTNRDYSFGQTTHHAPQIQPGHSGQWHSSVAVVWTSKTFPVHNSSMPS